MSYTNRNSGQTTGTAWIAVAALHGAALYALINGLGIDYIRETITNLPARNYETPAPPPPETMPEPKADQQVESTVDVAKPMLSGIPNRNVVIVDSRPSEDFTPIALPPVPDVLPPKPMPQFKPVGAMPKGSPGNWVSTNDYPTRDIRQGNEGTAVFLLAIGADGRVNGCEITRSSGHTGLDQATCSKVSQRARFDPAKDENGQRVPGTYAGSIKWVIPE